MMESSPDISPADQAVALISAEASRDELARRLDPGAWWFVLLATSIAVHIALSSIGVAENSPLVFIAGQLGFVALTALQIWLVRRGSGMRVGAFVDKVVLGVGVTASGVYAIALAGSMWAAFESQIWLAVTCATVGGIGYALAGRRWLRAYHERPQDLSSTASAMYVIVACIIAGVALVVLLTNQ